MAAIAVVGGGYVGLVTSACLSTLGHQVNCLEINPERLSMLRSGIVPIREPGLDELVAESMAKGVLSFSDDYGAVIPLAEYIFLAVNTPPRPDGGPDTRFVWNAVNSALEHIDPDATVVVKSTVPVGTAAEISALVKSKGFDGVSVVSNPEFLRQGSAVRDFLEPDRIVIGSASTTAGDGVAHLFQALPGAVIRCNWQSAELAKYAANALLATRISFINEVSALAGSLGADIEEIAEVLRADPRIGPHYLQAGLGWGGSCFPKDLHALAWMAREAGLESSLAESATLANNRQRVTAFDRILSRIIGESDATVCVLGLAFKPHTDDIRESPSLDVIKMLIDAGVTVRAHDPEAMHHARKVAPGVVYCESASEAIEGSHLIFLATEWPEYYQINWEEARDMMTRPVVLDGRHILDKQLMTELGFEYLSFGRLVEQKAVESYGSGSLPEQPEIVPAFLTPVARESSRDGDLMGALKGVLNPMRESRREAS